MKVKSYKRMRKCAARIEAAFKANPTLSEDGEYNSLELKREFQKMIHLCKGVK